MPIVPRLSRVADYIKYIPPTELLNPLACGLAKSGNKVETFFSTIIAPMATKLGLLLTYLEGLFWIYSHGPLITWSCKILQQTKNISLLPQ